MGLEKIELLSIVIILALGLTLLFTSYSDPIFAQEKEKDKDKKKEKDKDKDKIGLKVKIFLQDLERTGFLRITALFNGETITKDIQFSEIDPSKNTIKVDLEVDKDGDVVKASTGDEYIACVYHVKDLSTYNELTYFDCNEGDVESSSAPTTVSLFKPSSLVYKDSLAFYNSQVGQSNQVSSSSNKSGSNEKAIVKIYAPLSDKKDTKKLKIMVMMKGQVQSELIEDVQEELDKSKGNTISKTFTFDRKTDVGMIQLGDKFLACVASDDLRPPEGQECEKRVLKKFGKPNDLYAR